MGHRPLCEIPKGVRLGGVPEDLSGGNGLRQEILGFQRSRVQRFLGFRGLGFRALLALGG